jgi:hypothetical protein
MGRGNLIIGLLILIAILGYLNFEIYDSPIDMSPILAEDGGSDVPAPVNLESRSLPVARPLTEFDQTIARPIFTSDRHPIERKPKLASSESATGRPATEIAPKQLTLIGVMHAGKARALIRSSVSGQGGWMSIGEDIDGWRLREVADKKAVIETEGRRYQLFLYPSTNSY